MSKIGFIYKNKCHAVTQTYAESIGAVPIRITDFCDAFWKGIISQPFDDYFVESALSMLVPITKRFLGNNVTIIFRGNDELFWEKSPAYLHTNNLFKKWFLLFLIKQMDAIIVESAMTKQHAQQWTTVPIEVCESYVAEKKELEKIKPNLKTTNFLFIGEYRPPYDHKNIRFLLSVFQQLSNCHLTIIGKNTRQLQSLAPVNVEILDFVPDKNNYYHTATYYIHLPKYETGPITLLEAMTVGVIPITTSHAGHSSFVGSVAPDLVLSSALSSQEIARKIKQIISLPLVKKQKISETFKKNAQSHWNQEENVQHFQQTWKTLLE